FISIYTATPYLRSYSLLPYTTLFRSAVDLQPLTVFLNTNLRVLFRWRFDCLFKARYVLVKIVEGNTKIALRFIGIAEIAQTKRRSEEHTSELQSRFDLVCRLLLEKKK